MRRILATVLALALLFSLAVMGGAGAAFADGPEPCADGSHVPGEFVPANYTPCGGGYQMDHYWCDVCGHACDEDGNSLDQYCLLGSGEHTLGELIPADYTSCGGGFTVDYRLCTVCFQAIAVDGSIAPWQPGSGAHTPGSECHPADYTPCGGGMTEDYYVCIDCQVICDAEGHPLDRQPGTGTHTPGSECYPADYTSCGGGYTVDHYWCVYCKQPCDENGSGVEAYWQNGNGAHTLGEVQPVNYTSCGGGFTVDYRICSVCHQAFRADGTQIDWNTDYQSGTGTHTPGGECYPADYTSCGGGYTVEHYWCVYCEQPCDENGSNIEAYWQNGDGQHTLGECYPADYTPCGGGFTVEHRICSACHNVFRADGTQIDWDTDYHSGTGVHTPGSECYPAGYTSCGGGFSVDYYICADCGNPCLADGSSAEAYWQPGTGVHTPGSVCYPADYTPCGGGYFVNYYVCTDCMAPCHADGTEIDWATEYREGTGVHTPDGALHPANYTSCGGGYPTDYYHCFYCGNACDADGHTLAWKPGTGIHTPGVFHPASYTPCGGGYTVDVYSCVDCNHPCHADGTEIDWATDHMDGNGQHTPGSQTYPANYTPCGGGYTEAYYVCSVCGSVCGADGHNLYWQMGTGQHTPGAFEAATYTPCGGGYTVDHYLCSVCGEACDANGLEIWDYYQSGNGNHGTLTVSSGKPATCTESGIAPGLLVCSICGNYVALPDGTLLTSLTTAQMRQVEDEYVIPALGHDFQNGVCTHCGLIEEGLSGLACVDGVWGYYVNGAVDTGYTGLTYSGQIGWWYVENGFISFARTGLVYDPSMGWWYVVNSQLSFETKIVDDPGIGTWYVENGQITFSYNGTVEQDGVTWDVVNSQATPGGPAIPDGLQLDDMGWHYYKDGAVDASFTGLACSDQIGWWYVENGAISFSKTGLVCDPAMGWWYVKNSQLSFETRIVDDPAIGTWYVENGAITFTYNGTVTQDGVTYDVVNSQATPQQAAMPDGLQLDATGWHYYKNGAVDTSYTGLALSDQIGWWYVENGAITFSKTGMVCDPQIGWWYVENSQITFAHTGLVCDEQIGWWYIENSQLRWDFTGVAYRDDIGYWYCENSAIAFSFTGTVTYQGETWNVVGGQASKA